MNKTMTIDIAELDLFPAEFEVEGLLDCGGSCQVSCLGTCQITCDGNTR